MDMLENWIELREVHYGDILLVNINNISVFTRNMILVNGIHGESHSWYTLDAESAKKLRRKIMGELNENGR